MTLDDYIAKYNGNYVDYDHALGPQCVDLYRQYVAEVLGYPQSPPVVGASGIFDSASSEYYDKIKNTASGVPNKGDIMIWKGSIGHVGMVVSANVNTFDSFDQCYPVSTLVNSSGQVTRLGTPPSIQRHNYTNVRGWLRPKKSNPNQGGNVSVVESWYKKYGDRDVNDNDRQYFAMWEKAGELAFAQEIVPKTLAEKNAQLNALQVAVNNLTIEVNGIKDQLKICSEKPPVVVDKVLTDEDKKKIADEYNLLHPTTTVPTEVDEDAIVKKWWIKLFEAFIKIGNK